MVSEKSEQTEGFSCISWHVFNLRCHASNESNEKNVHPTLWKILLLCFNIVLTALIQAEGILKVLNYTFKTDIRAGYVKC